MQFWTESIALEIWPENAEKPIVTINVKGITLTGKALEIIKIESMVKLINDFIKNNGDISNLKVPQMQIISNNMHTVQTRYFDKILRVMSEKRRLDGNNTLPYGYIKNE